MDILFLLCLFFDDCDSDMNFGIFPYFYCRSWL